MKGESDWKGFERKTGERSETRRDRILAEADCLHAQHLTLRELRKAEEVKQVQLAEIPIFYQAIVAQMVWRSDQLLSTLRCFVEAMGSKPSLIVDFPIGLLSPLEDLGTRRNSPTAMHIAPPAKAATGRFPMAARGWQGTNILPKAGRESRPMPDNTEMHTYHDRILELSPRCRRRRQFSKSRFQNATLGALFLNHACIQVTSIG